ncbi:O-antigen ligase family protein [uncultured Psychroserpens sp.]|uniref:O-antigen ligase family protein n=1 Tax=uncultured Psychroserpens sp. TaxID=255436 RepID=UPI002635F1DF|nr:O-antigen ligase family protein [uncultured Psychroserpens sp.]
MKVNIYKILFIVLLLTLISTKVELSFAFAIVSLIISAKDKVIRPVGVVLFLFLIIFSIGFFGFLRSDYSVGVYIKDLVYFSRPILVILASYFLIKKISDKSFLFTVVILLGFAYSITHISMILMNLNKISNVTEVRTQGGRYNHLELIAYIFILTSNTGKVKLYLTKFTYNVFVVLLSISFILYFSRVMFVVLVLFILAYKGYFRLTKKGLRLIFFGTILLTSFMMIVNKFDVDSNSDGIEGFIFKIQNTYSEMFESLDIEKIKRDKRDLWKHWRGYEAQSAIETLNDKGYFSWAFGRGFGSTVDLGVEVRLANEDVRYIPILHNGFIYVLFKTGIVGLLVYMMYIIYLYSLYRLNSNSSIEFNINRLIVGCAFYIALSSLVVTGVFKPYDLSGIVLGALFALKNHYNENRHIRNERSA